MFGGIYPEAECKVNFVPVPVVERLTRSCEECIYCGLVDFCVCLVALALDCPETPARCLCNEIDAHVLAAKLVLGKKVIP